MSFDLFINKSVNIQRNKTDIMCYDVDCGQTYSTGDKHVSKTYNDDTLSVSDDTCQFPGTACIQGLSDAMCQQNGYRYEPEIYTPGWK